MYIVEVAHRRDAMISGKFAMGFLGSWTILDKAFPKLPYHKNKDDRRLGSTIQGILLCGTLRCLYERLSKLWFLFGSLL